MVMSMGVYLFNFAEQMLRYVITTFALVLLIIIQNGQLNQGG